ncbi:MAG: DUF4184 family protein [Ignavibacteriaceae bacterium]
MPFTFSHPAIVLPLTFLPRKWFSLTGLIIGSLTPDFEYFIRMKVDSDYSHTLSGIFWFDLPLGLILAFIFHNVLRDSLFDNLPTILKSRLSTFKQLDWNSYFKANWFVVIISILIGTITHIFWDGFTHAHGYFVKTIPELTNMVYLFDIQIPLYRIIQHISTLIGGLVIIFAIFKLPADKNVTARFNIKYWGILTGITLIIIIIRLLSGFNFKLYGNFIATGISAGLISLILTSLIVGKSKKTGGITT